MVASLTVSRTVLAEAVKHLDTRIINAYLPAADSPYCVLYGENAASLWTAWRVPCLVVEPGFRSCIFDAQGLLPILTAVFGDQVILTQCATPEGDHPLQLTLLDGEFQQPVYQVWAESVRQTPPKFTPDYTLAFTVPLSGFLPAAKRLRAGTLKAEEGGNPVLQHVHVVPEANLPVESDMARQLRLTAADVASAIEDCLLVTHLRGTGEALLPAALLERLLKIQTGKKAALGLDPLLDLKLGEQYSIAVLDGVVTLIAPGASGEYPEVRDAFLCSEVARFELDAAVLKRALRGAAAYGEFGQLVVRGPSRVSLDSYDGLVAFPLVTTFSSGTGRALLDLIRLKNLVEPLLTGTTVAISLGAEREAIRVSLPGNRHYHAGLKTLAHGGP